MTVQTQCSPLFSASMTELTKPPRRASNQDDDPLAGAEGGGEDEEEAGGIANMRVINASKVRGGSHGVRVLLRCLGTGMHMAHRHTEKKVVIPCLSCVRPPA